MTTMRLIGALTSAVLFAAAASAVEIAELPDGPDRDLVARECQACHDLSMVFAAAGFSRSDWDSTLEEMTTNGMNITAADRAKILDYLSTYLGPSPPGGNAR